MSTYSHKESIKKQMMNQQQIKISTGPNRYPFLLENFKLNLQALRLPETISILSFGCSKGYECIDLKKYFPKARIFGCDIHKGALKFAREQSPEDITYFYSDEENLRNHGPYDVILAFSVFCRYPDTLGQESIIDIYPASRMENSLSLLLRNLNGGGASWYL